VHASYFNAAMGPGEVNGRHNGGGSVMIQQPQGGSAPAVNVATGAVIDQAPSDSMPDVEHLNERTFIKTSCAIS
jgi:hypothetical protein